MLNYNDDEQTLLQFYCTGSLDLPVATLPLAISAKGASDTQGLETLNPAEQYDVLNQFLTAANSLYGRLSPVHDFQDPLSGENVAKLLVRKGVVESEADPQLQKFLVSSQEFNPQAYLSVVHENTQIEHLVASLDGLDTSIRRQTSDLKAVLDENFEDFLSCKRSIDEILASFRELKLKAQKDMEKSKVFNPSAQRNRTKLEAGESLLSELEESINNLNLSSSLMIRPIMDHNAKEAKINKLVEFIQANRFLFDLPSRLIEHLCNSDDESFINDYQKFVTEKADLAEKQQRAIADAEDSKDSTTLRSLEMTHAFQNTVLTRVYTEVAKMVDEYRQKCLQDLLSTDHEVNKTSNRKLALDVKFIDIVDRLHRVSMEESNTAPISQFLKSQLLKMESELTYECEKFETRFSLMQNKLKDYVSSLSQQRPDGSYVSHIAEKFDSVEEYFRVSSTYTTLEIDYETKMVILDIFGNNENLDLSIINETWLVLANFITYIEKFFKGSMSKFVKNYVHYSNSEFNIDNDGELQAKFFQIASDIIDKIMNIFDCGDHTDQLKITPSNYVAFLPYHTNSLSAIYYLSAISRSFCNLLTLLGEYTTKVGNSTKSFDINKFIKILRETSLAFDLRVLEAICATWVNDCSQFFDLENWAKYNIFGDKNTKSVIYTKLMQIIFYYEIFVLERLAQLLIRKTESNDFEVRIVSSYPSKRILVSLEIQFMRSMNVLVESILKKFTARRSLLADEGETGYETEKCIFKVLTMNNFTALGEFIFPKLIKNFDVLFESTLLKQSLKLFADLDKVKITILDDINEIEKIWIESKIDKHFRCVAASNISREVEVDPFVYNCLLHFVKLVHVLKPITDTNTFVAIIQQLQSHFLSKFLQCFRQVMEQENIEVLILANVKLDLDFFIEVFEASETLRLDDFCMNLVQIAFAEIQKVENLFADLPYTAQEIDHELFKALEYSDNEFTCFL
ncbi:hypothetical protein METBIDRAFT_41326 [Metschnikowia bicuspidata var. bicuspidata NRRL YB-4993]|uniref:Exocyst complex component SEC5 n=1 Tax=Metschnikowia bicuspidata var. bicuspidata NRRL YB-4993 TaxID=869754 RepID=A0A1A0HAK2_9ASCO|nr:hypothetical protein METBIDRAFT_41326 [Metschnikowia bicuspidata var. bicuspidata NRRL YB-4993]OBA21159.1 hypothetical protein METBIDRAFT_41326 [Metschnikowia bicuspidata var. bicuspidata NRRL YB-4993]